MRCKAEYILRSGAGRGSDTVLLRSGGSRGVRGRGTGDLKWGLREEFVERGRYNFIERENWYDLFSSFRI